MPSQVECHAQGCLRAKQLEEFAGSWVPIRQSMTGFASPLGDAFQWHDPHYCRMWREVPRDPGSVSGRVVST